MKQIRVSRSGRPPKFEEFPLALAGDAPAAALPREPRPQRNCAVAIFNPLPIL